MTVAVDMGTAKKTRRIEAMIRGEALKRWCPMARSWTGGNEGGAVVNRYDSGAASYACLCLAEHCMMWVERPGYDGRVDGKCGLVRE